MRIAQKAFDVIRLESSGDRGEPRGSFGITAEFDLVTRYAIQFREENGALDGGFQLSAPVRRSPVAFPLPVTIRPAEEPQHKTFPESQHDSHLP